MNTRQNTTNGTTILPSGMRDPWKVAAEQKRQVQANLDAEKKAHNETKGSLKMGELQLAALQVYPLYRDLSNASLPPPPTHTRARARARAIFRMQYTMASAIMLGKLALLHLNSGAGRGAW
jgi:hypothetical protein